MRDPARPELTPVPDALVAAQPQADMPAPSRRESMNRSTLQRLRLDCARTLVAASVLVASAAVAGESERGVLVLTSTNDPGSNSVVVFTLGTGSAASLSWRNTLPTGGAGGASNNAGILQFREDRGAVANFASNTVTQLVREDDDIRIGSTIRQASGCVKPDSVALTREHLFVVGQNCAESHDWPSGIPDGRVVHLSDPSAAQIAVGNHWSAVTMTSGSVVQLPLTRAGALAGAVVPIALPADADNTPLGEAFWGDVLGFTPAHSPDSFALVNEDRTVVPITGPTPPYPTNAPCWVAKGAGNLWYTGNSPGHAISIFFSDGQGGVFYKSLPLPGAPTDITVSHDGKWLAVIYSANGDAHVAVYSIDAHGDLTPAATSPSIGVAGFSGVAISD